MKKLCILSIILLAAAATFAGQPIRNKRNNPNIKDVLTFNNLTEKQKPASQATPTRIYALPEENIYSGNSNSNNNNPAPGSLAPHNFIPNPLVNYYRD